MHACRRSILNFYSVLTRSECRIIKTAQNSSSSTIYALSSGYGKCGVAVIRISGPHSSDAVSKMARMNSMPSPRRAVLRAFTDPETGEILDRGILIWFPGPYSFTGEDSCEFQVHGGPAVITAILSGLGKLPGFRPAEPGEFTRRAFHLGKLDLTEVEGLADLIDAETEVQRRQALLQMGGMLSNLYNNWRQMLVKNVAHVEAYIDFGEDESIEDNVMTQIDDSVTQLINIIKNHLSTGRCGERLRDGVRTVIVGEPNVGKSSLLNAICQRPAAIVTPFAGTTRDVIELHLNIGGYPVLLTDTAGLHNASRDEVEIEGMKRARTATDLADLILLVVDATRCLPQNTFETFLENYVENLGLRTVSLQHILVNKFDGTDFRITSSNDELKQYVIILNKIDLIENLSNLHDIVNKYSNVVPVSCKTEDGFPHLFRIITQHLITLCGSPSHLHPTLTQARHRHHLLECVASLEKYIEFSKNDNDIVFAAQQLRNATRHIGKITGCVSTEQILDVIFKDFCIGK
ncbi:tRNA modification GTPase GTPBP3, mitochondrial isoform X1 [Anabrus simplex]|uniref:tRNA modification GTPase GTPBP3, mitochondrial isoform X1 n=1 Tax=Anabrus simplex TaxID=316456 RepID=UPI0035A30075